MLKNYEGKKLPSAENVVDQYYMKVLPLKRLYENMCFVAVPNDRILDGRSGL